MMDVCTIEIPGEPIPKARPRFSGKGKFVRVYNGQRAQEKEFKGKVLNNWPSQNLSLEPLWIDLEFVFDRPKSHMGTGRNEGMVKKSAPKYHVVKPDKDNLEKFVLDCLEGLFYKNDSQVFGGITVKRYAKYGESQKTIITITSHHN